MENKKIIKICKHCKREYYHYPNLFIDGSCQKCGRNEGDAKMTLIVITILALTVGLIILI